MLKLTTKYGSKINLIESDGKFEYTYTPQHEDDFPCIIHSGRIGDEEITFLQLEEGREATGWVQNLSEASQLKKIWDGLHGISAEMTNEIEGLSTRIQIDLDGLMTEFTDHKKDTSTLIAQTENQLRLEAKDSINHAIQVTVPGMITQKINSIDYGSIIRQQSDNVMIALKGKGGDIINEINMSPGYNRISGKLTHITGSTLIDNGVIKDAHIGNLSASKITTGTLNAGNINVVGLSANNISGLNSEFVRTRWNNINSNITITGNSLVAKHRDGSQTIINPDGLYTRVGGTNYETHYLTHVQNVKGLLHRENSQGQPFRKWVQLPDVFKGKRFKPFVSVSDIYGHQGKVQESSLRLTRFVAYVEWDNIDYANAMVPLVGYASFMNVRSGYHEQHEIAVTLTVLY